MISLGRIRLAVVARRREVGDHVAARPLPPLLDDRGDDLAEAVERLEGGDRNDGSAMLEMPPFMIASYMLRNFPASWMSSSSVITSSGTSIT